MGIATRTSISGTVRSVLEIEIPNLLTRAAGIASFVALIGLGAHVKFFLPGNPVPVTLQTLFVLLAGAMLGAREGAAAVATYIVLGAVGVPIFAGAGPAGLAYLLGPTGGYLLGFLVAASVVGVLSRRARKLPGLAVAFLAGEIIILSLGVIRLAFFTGLDGLRWGLQRAWTLGAGPFLWGDSLKLAAACLIFHLIRKGYRSRFTS